MIAKSIMEANNGFANGTSAQMYSVTTFHAKPGTRFFESVYEVHICWLVQELMKQQSDRSW